VRCIFGEIIIICMS